MTTIPPGAEDAYARFLPLAEALDPGAVILLRADVDLAYHNALVGAAAVVTQAETVKKLLPKTKLDDLRAVPALASAVVFAARQVDRGAPASTELRALLEENSKLRALLLKSAASLAEAGLVPSRAVERIRQGHGPIDAARDSVDLAALFTKNAKAVKGKSPVTAAQIKRAAELGALLPTLLRPRAARRTQGASEAVRTAVDIRDRLWTLLVQRHDALWRAGAYLFGREVEGLVPGLQTRTVARRKASVDPPPPPPLPPPSGSPPSAAAPEAAARRGKP